MAKTKEQDRMEAAILLGGMMAETPHLLFGVQKMLESPWFVELPRGIRKRAKNLVARLDRAAVRKASTKGTPVADTGSGPALFDLRSKVPATPPPAQIRLAPPDPATEPNGECPQGIHILNGGDCDCPRSVVPAAAQA